LLVLGLLDNLFKVLFVDVVLHLMLLEGCVVGVGALVHVLRVYSVLRLS